MDQGLLKEKLDNTVESCVNSVGVNLNTASPYLLQYVAGIGPALSKAIVDYRSANGDFTAREQLLQVPRLGAKAFQQCAGFLRIPGATHPLDNSAVHPEAYHIVDRMARDLHVSPRELVGNAALCKQIKAQDYVEKDFGLPTINDIIQELQKPGRDPREAAQEFSFADDIHDIEDLKVGMELPGLVTNLTAFGAFVDIGLHENGLIHASQMGVRGMAVPSKVLKLHQHVKVQVLSVDLDRKPDRIKINKIKRLLTLWALCALWDRRAPKTIHSFSGRATHHEGGCRESLSLTVGPRGGVSLGPPRPAAAHPPTGTVWAPEPVFPRLSAAA